MAELVKRHQRCASALGGGMVLLVGFLTTAAAQEAVRMSMASAQAAEMRHRAATTIGYHNLKLGPTAWRFGAGMGLEYNDNVNYTADNPQGDFIFRPQINTRLFWPVSDRNSINLALGAGYSAYVQHSELSRYFITPDSELSFDLYAGDFWINLHDRISITESSYQDPTVAGTGDYAQLQNTLGVSALWDLNKAVLRWGYDHQNYSYLSSTQNQPDGQAEVFSTSAGYAPRAGTLLGVELGGMLLDYSGANTRYSDARQWNVGGFYESQLSDYIHFTGHAGYTEYKPDSSRPMGNGGDLSGIYAQLALTHRVNQYVDYSLSGGRSISSTLQGGTVVLYTANWRANWRVFRKTTLSTSFVYNHGTEAYGSGEIFDQYGPQISLGRRLSDKLSSSLGYQFYWRTSDEPGRDYTVNIVSLNLQYTF